MIDTLEAAPPTEAEAQAVPGRHEAEIYLSNLPALVARLEKLNKRALKLGVAPVVLESGEPFTRSFAATVEQPYGYTVDFVNVTVTGETPKLAGWSLAAVKDHSPDLGEPLFQRVPGVEADLSAFRERGTDCEHCRVNRKRHEVFVLLNDDARLIQVGRDCLVDFLGGVNPAALVAAATFLLEVLEALADGGESSDRRVLSADTVNFLAVVSAIIRTDGWVSRGAARQAAERGNYSLFATADGAWSELFPAFGAPPSKLKVVEADFERAKLAREWAAALDPLDGNEYLANLGRVARNESVGFKRIGILGSAISAHAKSEARELERRKAATDSTHVGEIGKRLKWGKKTEGLTVTVLGSSEIPSDFRTCILYRLIDPSGNRLKWFASGGTSLEDGVTYKVDGTIKKHDTWHGVKETLLSRVKVIDEVAVNPEP